MTSRLESASVRAMDSDFGGLLRRWRSDRRYTQERLALEAEVSTRHLSYLESGKAAPSREMVLVLASTLDLPLRDRNLLLGAAGFAPAYGRAPLDSEEAALVRRALELILAKQEPFGAVVFDRLGEIVRMNRGAERLIAWAMEGEDVDPRALSNIHRAVLDPRGLRRFIVNWSEVAGLLLERLHREVALHPEDTERRALLDALLRAPDLPKRAPVSSAAPPMAPVILEKRGQRLRLFTTLTTLGTPLDVGAQELSIETYYPMDAETERFLLELARTATTARS